MTLLCAARCAAQPRQAAPGYRICWTCRDWLGRNLHTLAELSPDLEAAMAHGSAMHERVDTSPEPPLPLNLRAAAARYAIHHDLVVTVRIVHGERGLASWPADAIDAMALWLAAHVDWLCAHGNAGQFANEAGDWVAAARGAINPNPPKIVRVGACPMPGCAGELTAVVRPQDSMLPSAITCSWWADLEDNTDVEPHTWRADQWHALGRQMARAEQTRREAIAA